MAAKASLEQFDVILTAGPKGLDIEDEKLLNTLRSPKRTLEPESVGFPFVSHHNFSVPWETEGEILHHFVWVIFFFSLFPILFDSVWLALKDEKVQAFRFNSVNLSWPMAKELKMRNYADRVLVSYARRLRRLDRIYFEMLSGDLDETNIARKQ